MLPDPGRYEERYRLTGAALGLASAVLALGLGFLWHAQLIFAALTVLLAIPPHGNEQVRPGRPGGSTAGGSTASSWPPSSLR